MRRDTAIVFDLYFHVLRGQYRCSEVEDFRKGGRIEPVVEIICCLGLEQAGIPSIVQYAAAVDEALRQMTDLSDVEIGGNHGTIGKERSSAESGCWLRKDLSSCNFIPFIYTRAGIYSTPSAWGQPQGIVTRLALTKCNMKDFDPAARLTAG